MKTFILALTALVSTQAHAVELKAGTLQHVVTVRQLAEVMDPTLYYAYQLSGGKKLEEANMTRGQAQTYLWYLCKDHASLVARINLVDVSQSPELREAKRALESMRCESFFQLEFTSMRDLIARDRDFRIAYFSIQTHNKKVLAGEAGNRAPQSFPRAQVNDAAEDSPSSSAQ